MTKEQLASIVSSFLWEAGAFKISPDKPFKLASGNHSPIYVDCRALISHAPAMDMITSGMRWLCESEQLSPDVIAGGESAGIPFASFLAQRLAKPMAYVRKQAKGYGLESLVVGSVKEGSTALLVEDLITDGGSKLGFVRGLRHAGCRVADCLVVFDREQGGDATLRAEEVRLISLATLSDALAVGMSQGRMAKREREQIEEYLDDPKAWHQTRGLPYV